MSESKNLSEKLPGFLQKYFWETNAEEVNPQKETFYVVERLLDWGDLKVFKWLVNNFSEEYLKEVVTKSRKISNFNKLFWCNYLDIAPKEELCNQKEFLKKQNTAWKY